MTGVYQYQVVRKELPESMRNNVMVSCFRAVYERNALSRPSDPFIKVDADVDIP